MSLLSRRTLVRTGVTTAWTAPIVVVAVPASAAACSGGPVQLAAQEVPGSRVESFNTYNGRLTVEVTVLLANSGVAGSLVSASVTSAHDNLEEFVIGRPGLGDIGTITGPQVLTLTATPSPSVPLAAQANQEFTIEYTLFDAGFGFHTIDVSFQPDCGAAAVCSITTDI